MCQLKSVLILKDKVFCPDYDSHDEMLRELGIMDTRENAQRLFVRAEITPANMDLRLPVAAWKYKVDQDIIPEWYVAEVDEERARKAVEEWAKVHVLTEGHHDYRAGRYYLYGTARATLYDTASAELYDSARAELYDSARAELYDTARAELYDTARAELYNSASAELYDSARAELYNSASADLYNSASAELYNSASAELYDSASGIIFPFSSNDGKEVVLNDAAVLVNHRDGIIRAWGKEIKRND